MTNQSSSSPQIPQIPSIGQWIAHIDGLIREPLGKVPFNQSQEVKQGFIASFRDEYGSRRSTDGALLSRVLEVPYCVQPTNDPDLDVRLWDALHDDSDWIEWISESDGLVLGDYAIEHRTLIELSALHAFWNLARRSPNQSMLERIDALVDWHTRELQPDNGINRPWGVHAFIVRSIGASDEQTRLDAMLHAQTLVNNCCINLGKPDILSAMILRDSAGSLSRMI